MIALSWVIAGRRLPVHTHSGASGRDGRRAWLAAVRRVDRPAAGAVPRLLRPSDPKRVPDPHVGPCTWLSTGHCWRRGDEARVRAVGPSVCSLFSNTRRRRIGRSGERVARAETAAAVTAKTRTLIVAAKTGASTLSENPMYSCAWKGRK